MKNIKLFFTILLMAAALHAQSTLNIGIIKDADSQEFDQAANYIKSEAIALTKARFNVTFTEFNGNWNSAEIRQTLQRLMKNPDINLLVTVGFISSNEASKLANYPKPLIAATILDQSLQKLPLKFDKSTGVNNFTYIESVIQLKDDIRSFSQMFDVQKAVVIIPKPLIDNMPDIVNYIAENGKGLNISVITADKQCSGALAQLPQEADAAFVLPLFQSSDSEIEKLLQGLNEKKIPSLAVGGIKYLQMGATVTFTPQYNFQQLARQTAIRILKVGEGTNLSRAPVSIEGIRRGPVINMAGIRLINRFPHWSYLNEAILINTTEFPSASEMNYRMVIAEALENNLQGKISDKDLLVAEKNVRIAKANIYPQIEISGTAIELSENLVEASMGQKGAFTLSGSAMLKQVIFSEAVFANITINKLMEENKKAYNRQTVLEIISNVSNAYIGLLFSKSNLHIQSENVNATMQNLQMAKAKEKAGQSGISDVNRWISELNMNKMKLNDAYTMYRTAMYQLNQLLNKPIDEGINITENDNFDESVILDINLLKKIFENPILTEKYASFIIEQMYLNSPELKQLNTAKEIIKRKKSLYKNRLYLPDVAVWGGLDQAFIRNGTIKPVGMPVPPPPDDLTWNVGLKISLPIYEGGKTYTEMQKSKIELDKINDQKEDLLNKLEAGIRANVQKSRTSYLEVELSKNAAKAAKDNFKVVQDGYFQGVTNLVQLIDAQTVMARTKHLANIAYYQFILDYLQVERLQGKYIFLSSADELTDYTNQLKNYLQDLSKGE